MVGQVVRENKESMWKKQDYVVYIVQTRKLKPEVTQGAELGIQNRAGINTILFFP